jgi:hypothetical protein
MGKSSDYQKHADECSLMAVSAANEKARLVWREMENYWRRRAKEADTQQPPSGRAT